MSRNDDPREMEMCSGARVARIAARQRGLITSDQLRAAGVSDWGRRKRVVEGDWVIVRRGLLRIAGAPETWEQSALAACLGRGSCDALSHRSAAAMWGMADLRRKGIEVVVRSSLTPMLGSASVTVHRTRWLPASDLTRRDGLPVTSPGRTIVDLARVVSSEVLALAVDDALSTPVISLRELRRVIEDASRRRRTGAAALGRTLSRWSPGRPPESPPEARLARRLAGTDLPAPERQWSAVLEGGLRVRLDFAWPEERVAIEVDGFFTHGRPDAFESDRRRDRSLAAAGWRVLRLTARDIDHDFEDVRKTIAATLARAASGPT